MKRMELATLRKDLTTVLDRISDLSLDDEFPRNLMKFDPDLIKEIGNLL